MGVVDSAHNNFGARILQDAGLATLLIDLLTEEEAEDRRKVGNLARWVV